MRRGRLIGVPLGAALLWSGPALARDGARGAGQADGSATVAVRIAIGSSHGFVLGTVLVRARTLAGTIAVDPSGVQTLSGDLIPDIAAARPAQASFVVSGEADQSISIAIPATIDIARSGGPQRVTIALTTDLPAHGGVQVLAAEGGGAGRLAFNVGGRIAIDRSTVSGRYQGVLTATAQYN